MNVRERDKGIGTQPRSMTESNLVVLSREYGDVSSPVRGEPVEPRTPLTLRQAQGERGLTDLS